MNAVGLCAAPIGGILLAASVTLNGGPPVRMDYAAYDPATDRIWVPAGNTGAVDVVNAATGQLMVIPGLATAPPRRPGRPRVGPSSATVAEGIVWIGNRADQRLLAYDAKTLHPRGGVQLAAMPDGIQYVRRTRELWVTMPSMRAVAIVATTGGSGSGNIRTGVVVTPSAVTKLTLPGVPEGYAVDEARGLFYTNLEDADRTLAIDVAARKVVANWPATCGTEGPRGLAVDEARRWLFVACTNGARVLDLAGDGAVVGRIDTGGGVDNLAYDAARRRLFVASPKDAQLTVVEVADGGTLRALALLPTVTGARNPIVDARGTVYVEDAVGGRLLILTVPPVVPRR